MSRNERFLRVLAEAYFNNTCQLCGVQTSPLHIHHIDGNPKNNSLDNLTALCSKCHWYIHSHPEFKLGKPRDTVKAEGPNFLIEFLNEALSVWRKPVDTDWVEAATGEGTSDVDFDGSWIERFTKVWKSEPKSNGKRDDSLKRFVNAWGCNEPEKS